ncbi:hypothetical protein [Actinomadura kijaniata]|uniref:hypothetical protein n=1 Tax=Actinomadura kijaniata TaxID=46161 RepID=UPI00083356B4
MYSDADAVALYPWDPASVPGGRLSHDLVMGADAVLDVGCGTGMALAHARASGHGGRLVGAGFAVEERYGGWDRTPVTGRSREIVTVAVRG